jgi:3-deoxy-7-phosphoheptulonate synthase
MKDVSPQDLAGNLRRVARQSADHSTVVRVGGALFGDGQAFTVIAGPCTVESRDQVLDIARAVKAAGATMLRGGAFKPLTFPYRSDTMFELGMEGLRYLQEAGRSVGLPIVSEVTDPRRVAPMAELADMLQIGARNMQNFPLLEEVGRAGRPVLLKRHFGASVRDWLGAAEYLLHHGSAQVVLCERGIVAPHTHVPTSRFIVDLQAVLAAKELSHLPVIVDPSHATFKRTFVAPIARAALAVGADGIILDVHPVPEKAAVDPLQALSYDAFGDLMTQLRAVGSALGRIVAQADS